MKLTETELLEVADTFGISHPAIVEKDYYVVQLLKILEAVKTPGYQLVFAGGTCLEKVHQIIFRMSEDIDIKLIELAEITRLSRTKKKNLLKEAHINVLSSIEESEIFKKSSEPLIRNEYHFQHFSLKYPNSYNDFEALRPEIKLELVASTLFQPPILTEIKSFYTNAKRMNGEVSKLLCVDLESIISEKIISILRRTAAFNRDNSREDDPTLVRHVYDIHLAMNNNCNTNLIYELVEKVIEIDRQQFGRQHPQFLNMPKHELNYGLSLLRENPLHKKRYEEFIGPLVYHLSPPNWETAFYSLEKLVKPFFLHF